MLVLFNNTFANFENTAKSAFLKQIWPQNLAYKRSRSAKTWRNTCFFRYSEFWRRYWNIANIYFSQDDTQPAWQALRTAHEINPSNDHALLGLAVLHAAEGQWDEALTIWRSLASEYPFFADIDQVVERYYRWNPPMADLVHQIAARLDPATA